MRAQMPAAAEVQQTIDKLSESAKRLFSEGKPEKALEMMKAADKLEAAAARYRFDEYQPTD